MFKTPMTKFLLADEIPGENGSDLLQGKFSNGHLPTINELGKQLLAAAGDGNVDVIRALMSKGAPFTADWLGTSPLHLAAQNNHLNACQVLLVAGMSRDARTKVDRTPLHVACYEGHLEIVECLLSYNADYDAKDILQMTPLHWATQNGHAEIVELLIRYGAQTRPVNKFDLTPGDIAQQINRPDIGEIINLSIRDPLAATQNLAMELIASEAEQEEQSLAAMTNEHAQQMHLDAIMIDDQEEDIIQPETIIHEPESLEENPEEIVQVEPEEAENPFTESMKLLQQHGITMLPVDESNILNSVMESGHSVVLTEAGKQALNAIKPVEPEPQLTEYLKPKVMVRKKRIITLTPEEFIAMTNGKPINTHQNNGLKQLKILNSPKQTFKRIVMRKNKILPVSPSVNVTTIPEKKVYDVEHLMDQLQKAHTLIESYKRKLLKSEVEAAKYKQQLKHLLEQHKLATS